MRKRVGGYTVGHDGVKLGVGDLAITCPSIARGQPEIVEVTGVGLCHGNDKPMYAVKGRRWRRGGSEYSNDGLLTLGEARSHFSKMRMGLLLLSWFIFIGNR